MNMTLCFEFCDAFSMHLCPPPIWGVVNGDCEAMVHNIQATLDINPNWVVLSVDIANAFNIVFHIHGYIP